MNIRPLDLSEMNNDDLNALAEKIRGYYEHSRTLIDIDIATVKANWEGFVSSGFACIFVVEEEGVIVGIISGMCYPDPLSGRMIAQEVFWFVDKECRHKGYGGLLINTFEAWGKMKNATAVRLAHLADLRAGENKALYEGLGYTVAEVAYEKEVC